jgi:hypothetical protein
MIDELLARERDKSTQAAAKQVQSIRDQFAAARAAEQAAHDDLVRVGLLRVRWCF